MNSTQAGITTAFAFVGLALLWRHGWVPHITGWLQSAPGGHFLSESSQTAQPASAPNAAAVASQLALLGSGTATVSQPSNVPVGQTF